MKTFKDLVFKPHYVASLKQSSISDPTAIIAKMRFPDGSFISVIKGDRSKTGFYCGFNSYEMLTTRTSRKNFSGQNEAVHGWVSPERITNHMKYIQRNPLTRNVGLRVKPN